MQIEVNLTRCVGNRSGGVVTGCVYYKIVCRKRLESIILMQSAIRRALLQRATARFSTTYRKRRWPRLRGRGGSGSRQEPQYYPQLNEWCNKEMTFMIDANEMNYATWTTELTDGERGTSAGSAENAAGGPSHVQVVTHLSRHGL